MKPNEITTGVVMAPLKATAYCEVCQAPFEAALAMDDEGLVSLACPVCQTVYAVRELVYRTQEGETLNTPMAEEGITAHPTWLRWVCVECGVINPARQVTSQVRCSACRAVLPVEGIIPLTQDEIERAGIRVRAGLSAFQNKEKAHDGDRD